jgi:hypothetical protein
MSGRLVHGDGQDRRRALTAARRVVVCSCILASILVPGGLVSAQSKPDPQGLGALVQALVAPEAEVRLDAERRVLLAGPAAVVPLVDVFAGTSGSSPELKKAAARLLPKLGPAALPELFAAGRRDASRGGPACLASGRR